MVNEYLDTVGQIGLIAVILVAMGAVAKEREMGTAAMTLSKPVGCAAFITSKFAVLALTFGIGIAVGGPNMNDVVVYDYEKCIEVLISRDGMSYSDAMEYMDYNVVGGYVGENTPMFVNTGVVK